MIADEHLTKIYRDQRAVDDLYVHPGRLSRLVIGSVRSIIATGRFGLSLLTRARRHPDDLTRKLPR
jgi:hypothetical protein